ncbi:DnaJ-class molecular chaperone [Desulfofundulus luciae]|uniref:DnaJ-class molecular chaperone n=1 Tax=Desulfofundulus luciae TaxID=74702 RepID=A0ABU0B671_9FIRM|nr:hypothetical protein [Desulfofundulus luciae]MDQ0287755.1 DnaJ-class molecular chaperone [Desulfofundulus luciae]
MSVETCPTCGGTGQEKFGSGSELTWERQCLTCGGVGKVYPTECPKCGRVIGTDMVAIHRMPAPLYPWCGEILGGR